MNFVVVTGMSGAGKSQTIAALEDIGYYCIDNIPPKLIENFAEICEESKSLNKIAVVSDTRGRELFSELSLVLDNLKKKNFDYKMLFLDASDSVLNRRFKETRRKHPLSEYHNDLVSEAIKAEREMLSNLRLKADFVIDTSLLSIAQLKSRISDLFMKTPSNKMMVQCMSFGFKYGPATDADLQFDMRCLPNPFYIPELKNKTGLDKEVSDYVMSSEQAQEVMKRLKSLVDYMIPLYRDEGKSQLVIAIGCTGGKHRSVTFAQGIYEYLKEQRMQRNCNSQRY